MTLTAANVIVGDAQLYIAPSGTASPVFATTGLVTTPTTPWVAVGFTETGVTLNVDRKVDEIRMDEQSTPVLIVPDTMDVTIDVTLGEDVLSNAQMAYGGATLTTTAPSVTAPGMTTLTLSDALTTLALCFVAVNAESLNRLFYVPEVMSAGKVKTQYQRTKKARTYPTTFTAICAPSAISFIDATAPAS